MMGDIYRQASCVYAWMGTDDADIEYTLRYASLPATMRHSSGFDLDKVYSGAKQVSMRPYWTRYVSFTSKVLTATPETSFLIGARMWTIQECVVNESLIIVCGSRACGWLALEAAVAEVSVQMPPNSIAAQFPGNSMAYRDPADKHQYYEDEDIKVASRPDLSPLNRITQARKSFASGQERLVDLVYRLADAECSDAHDKVYGLLALAMDGDQLAVDYASGLFGVVVQTLSTTWKTELHFLRCAEAEVEHLTHVLDDIYEDKE